MKLVTLRLSDYLVTLNEEEWPLKYSYQVTSIGFSIEVRINNQRSAYVNGTVSQDGEPHYAGKYFSSYSDGELYRYISMEAFNVAASLGVLPRHIWPLLEQFPGFSENGVRISDAEAYEGPIRDLLARGAGYQEVIHSLGISQDLYEFVTCEKMPLAEPEQMMLAEASSEDGPGW